MFSVYLKTSYAYVLPPILGFFVLTGLALTSIIKRRKSRTNILFAAICFMGALINFDVALVNIIPDKHIALIIDRGTYVFFVFSVPVYIQFVHSFLGLATRKGLEWAAYIVSIAFLLLVPTDLFIKDFVRFDFGIIAQAGQAFHFFSLLASLTVLYCLYTLFVAMKKTPNNRQKNRIKYVLGGMGLSSFLLALNILPVSGMNVYPMGNFSFVPALVLGVGVLKYDLLDMGAVVRRGTAYFFLTITLTVVYLLFISALNILFIESAWNHTVLLPFLLALLMVACFNPIKNRLQNFIDHLFFRGKYDYRQFLKRMSGELATLLNFEEIRQLLTGSIAAALEVNHVALLVMDDEGTGTYVAHGPAADALGQTAFLAEDDPLIIRLKTIRRPLSELSAAGLTPAGREAGGMALLFAKMDASLMIPMLAGESLIGAIVLGQKKSGELFVHEDMELLTTIANQSATAIENARIYKQLEQLNRELEKKVEERTADLRHAMAEKEKAQAQLIRSESLAAIGQLVAGTAHELNNPLASASSLIQTAIENVTDGVAEELDRDDLLDDLAFSLVELKRAGDIVRSLLSLSRQTQTYVEPVNLNAVMEDALRVLHNQYRHLKITMDKWYDPDLPNIEGNFANLGQVFINIITNALQSLPEEEGTITLSTSYDAGHNSVIAECRDTGTGISAEHLKDIFKPFFTTKTTGRGTGLGLYICHEIIRRHGGNITVTSKPGEGSTFKIELPCTRREL